MIQTTASATTHSALTHIKTHFNGELMIGNTPIRQLAARVGQTPFYAYDRQLIQQRVGQLRRTFPQAIKLHYALKANPMPAVVHCLASHVDGMDVASAGELQLALNAGVNPADISFAGPGKTPQELRQAVAAGILINIESFREVTVLSDIAETLGLPARVAIRINPDFELKSSGMKMAGGPRPFGVDAELVPTLLDQVQHHGLKFEGFHVFAGSQNLRAEAIIEAQQKSWALVTALAQAAPAPVRFVNLGGGFGIPYFPADQPLTLDPIARNLAQICDDAAEKLPQAELVIELGRYLVGEAGVYICRVLDRKISRDHTFLVTDGGLHHHLAASGNFGQVLRKNYPLAVATQMHSHARETVSVVGPLCTPLDLLGDRVTLAPAQPGDLIAVFQSGAYGPSASPQQFLSHPPVCEVLV